MEWMATVVGREGGVVIGELRVDVGGELMGGRGPGREERREGRKKEQGRKREREGETGGSG